MAHGKEAARDVRWGRQGGRWANDQDVDKVLADIDRMRTKGLKDGTWPDGTSTSSDERPCTICGLARNLHGPSCDYCGRPPEHHADGDLDVEIAGRARMALARRPERRDHIDRMAIRHVEEQVA